MQYLKFINQTEAVCLEAVKSDGDALQYVDIKSEAVLKIATAYKEEYTKFCKS